MIARSWRADVPDRGVADRYVAHFHERVAPFLRDTPGFQGVYVWCAANGTSLQITVVTFWTSMEAIRGFAGDDVDAAVVHPAAEELLMRYDARVRHAEVLIAEPSRR